MTTTIVAGTFGVKCSRTNRATKDPTPMARVSRSHSGISRSSPTSWLSVFPAGFSTPTTLGSCPTAMKTPSPTMNPSRTGRANSRAMNPSLNAARTR